MAIDAFSQAYAQVNWDRFRPAATAGTGAVSERKGASFAAVAAGAGAGAGASASNPPAPVRPAPPPKEPALPSWVPKLYGGMTADEERTATQVAASEYGDRHATDTYSLENGTEDLSFDDVLDIVNPLQHIPIVSQLYRSLTGDTIKPSIEIVGGILYGGILGGAGAAVNAIIRESSGKDIGDHMMAAVFGEDEPKVAASPHPTQIVARPVQPSVSDPVPTSVAVPSAAIVPEGANSAATPSSPPQRSVTPALVAAAAPPAVPSAAPSAERAKGMPVFGAVNLATEPPSGYRNAAQRQTFGSHLNPLAVSRTSGNTPQSGQQAPGNSPASSPRRPGSLSGGGSPLMAPQPATPLPAAATANLRPAVPAQGLLVSPTVPGNGEGPETEIEVGAGERPAAPRTTGKSAAVPQITPEQFSQIMARNLQKYQKVSRGAAPAPSTRVSG